MSQPPVDLRSDTVTRPTPAMRDAMAGAEVGDDVFGDDPTVNELERRIAALTGKEASLFVPSGTMGNQLAVNALAHHGDEVLLGEESHVFLNEQGGIAANSGCLAHPVPDPRGRLPVEALTRALRNASDHHVARLSLVCVENTHNVGGGRIVPLEHLRALRAACRERGLRLHLDGARLWNASVATGIPIAAWAAEADTVMMCFSKGLGAPVGSILAGDSGVIARARRTRKRWGGGMRQAGVLAAAALHALDHHVARLADDHARAKRLAQGFGRAAGVAVAEPETNIVFVELEDPSLAAPALAAALERHGVRALPFGPRRLRAIVHLDVDDAGVERAIAAFLEAVPAAAGTRR